MMCSCDVVAVCRVYEPRRAQVHDEVKKKAFEDGIDSIRTSNNLDAKYTIVEREP